MVGDLARTGQKTRVSRHLSSTSRVFKLLCVGGGSGWGLGNLRSAVHVHMVCFRLPDAWPASGKDPGPCTEGNLVSKMVKSEWRFRLPKRGVVGATMTPPLGRPPLGAPSSAEGRGGVTLGWAGPQRSPAGPPPSVSGLSASRDKTCGRRQPGARGLVR